MTVLLPRYGMAAGTNILSRTDAEMQFQIDAVKRMGGGLIRTDVFNDSTALAAFGRLVGFAKDRGVQLMGVLYGTTGPRSPDGFAAAQVAAFPDVLFWEICNEPDLNGWTPNQYADFVAPTSDAILGANPNAKVIAGALFTGAGLGTATDPKAFTVALCTRAAGKFHYLSLHLYDDAWSRHDWNIWDWTLEWGGQGFCDYGANGGTVRKALNDNGHQYVPIIASEGGGPLFTAGGGGNYTLQEQADIMTHGLSAVGQGQIQSFLVYSLNNLEDPTKQYGVLDLNMNPRPSFFAFQAAARASNGAVQERRVAARSGGVR